jgi:hypothetical protein|tara:strand:+ start:416 stop:751 length:336 start_codon:yes stop_codon:yes gene_type:complete
MYLIRRTFKIQKGKTRDAAEAAKQISAKFQDAGQRTPVWIYISGTTTPGSADTIYMDWVEEKLEDPYRQENKTPDGLRDLIPGLYEYVEESKIEFFQYYGDTFQGTNPFTN